MKRVFCLLIGWITMIYGGHPLNTDDAGTVGGRSLQVEFLPDFLFQHTSNEYGLPLVLTYGIANRFDLVLEWPFCITCNHEHSTSSFNSGWLEPALTVKWNVWQKSTLAMAVKPGFTLPLESESFAQSNDVKPGLTLLVTKYFPKGQFSFNGGYLWNRNDLEQPRHLWMASTGFEYELGKGFVLAWDLLLEKNAEQSNWTDVALINGFQYHFDQNLMISVGVLSGLDHQNSGTQLLTGVTWIL